MRYWRGQVHMQFLRHKVKPAYALLFAALILQVGPCLASAEDAHHKGAPWYKTSLKVTSQDSSVFFIYGFFTDFYTGDGTEDDGFTPHVFLIRTGQTYTVHAEDFGRYRFHSWVDSTVPAFLGTMSNSKGLTEVYYTAPAAPQNLTSDMPSPFQIYLSWLPPRDSGTEPVTEYEIERSPDGSGWTSIANETGATHYSDTGVFLWRTYYRVIAISPVGAGPPSNTTHVISLASSTMLNDSAIARVLLPLP